MVRVVRNDDDYHYFVVPEDELPPVSGDAWVVVAHPMPRWKMMLRWLLRKPNAEVYPVRINPPGEPGPDTVTFTVSLD